MPIRSIIRGSRLPLALTLVFTVVAAACSRDATAPHEPPHQPPPPSFAPALMEITISGIGGQGELSASASPGSLPTLSVPSPSSSLGGVSRSLSAPENGGGTGDGTIELEPLSTGSFTQGDRTSGGYRYIWATFRVRNAESDGTTYDTPRTNLTFFAASAAVTLGGSAIVSAERFDGSAADPAIAMGILPTGSVSQVNGQPVPSQADVLQVLSESEAAAIAAPAGAAILPYGFVVRNATDGGRTLSASPAAGVYDGVVTFAFKVPLQASPAADPFTITALFLAMDDSETRITQSLEEQTPAGEAAFAARATAIGATVKSVLPGSYYVGADGRTRTLCTIRTAGSAASPTVYLVHRPVASVSLTDPASGWPLWPGGSIARELGVVARDSDGVPVPEVPVQLSPDAAGVLTAWDTGGVRMLPRRDRVSTTVTGAACGATSAPLTLRTSAFIPLSGATDYSLALRTDGSVVAWGDNRFGQTNLPAGLTDVVQIDNGGYHSLALRSNGTVVAWGSNVYGESSVPPGLTDVVQVASGGLHSLVLKKDGTVVAWGQYDKGQATVPPGLTGVVQIAAGLYHSLALKSDGTVVAWGDNSQGQTSVPTELTGVVQIAGGSRHSLALKSDGTVVAWGDNSSGQATVPPGLTNVVQVAAGDAHSLALKSDGIVVAWGDNSSGQATVPPGLTDVVQVAAGDTHSIASRSNGAVVAWGNNSLGQTNVPTDLVATVP